MKLLLDIRGIILGLVTILAIQVWVMNLPPDLYERVIMENGLIELTSVAGYLIGACWLFFCGFQKKLSHGIVSGLLVFGLALRELDFHVRFTTMGIFKTRFYLTNEVPVPEKIIVSIIVILMLAALLWYALKYGRFLLEGLRQKSSWAYCIAISIVLAGITKTFDRNSFEINEFTTNFFNLHLEMFLRVSEEVWELGIPLFILLAIYNELSTKQD